MPVQDVHAAVGTNFDAESDPGQVVGRHEVITMLADETGTAGLEHIGQDGMLVDVAHEQPVAVLLRKRVGQVEACPAVSRQVRMITNCLDVVVNVRIHVRATLLVIHASLDDVEQVRDDAAGGCRLAVIVEVDSPRV